MFPTRSEPVNKELPAALRSTDDGDAWQTSGSVVVITSFSGGGKRAAAFAYGVMLGLESIELEMKDGGISNLLEQVDFISAVSGGAIPALYYSQSKISSQNKQAINWQAMDNFLYENTNLLLFVKAINPFNWSKPLPTITAEYFDAKLFSSKTFSDLAERPYLIIGATDVSTGKQFTFTQKQFNRINSDLRKFPIGYIAAASAAFPLFFGNITLENFNQNPSQEITGLNQGKGKFIPLSDGGLVDNLAIEVYSTRLLNGQLLGTARNSRREQAKALIFIRVDGSSHLEAQFDDEPESPGFFKRMDRSMSVIFETQVDSVYKNMKGGFDCLDNKSEGCDPRLSQVDFEFYNVRLKDAPYKQLSKIPTSWSLKKDEVKNLIQAGKQMILEDKNKMKRIKTIFAKTSP